MRKLVIGLSLILLLFSSAASAVELNSKGRDSKYVENIVGRAGKIVDAMKIADKATSEAVRTILANRYFELNDIYERRDSIVNQIKASSIVEAQKKHANEAAQNEKDAAIYRSHFGFLAQLSFYLSPEQVTAIKDGMTFGVFNVTNTATLEMIPSLTDEEKKQIYVWLVEAREYAMNAESSNKKHEVFGRYKGRINNYLSKRGYDLVAERKAWYERIKKQDKK